MSVTIENFLLIGSVLLIISVIAGKTSYKFGVPVLIFFLGIGMLAGSEGIGGIHFDNPAAAQFIGIVALNFILFSGGLDTDWRSVKPILKEGIALSTVGVFLTAISLGLFVYWLLDFTLFESFLLGAIVSSTDAAAVFSILRGKNLALKDNLRSTLELESGSNDPMAYVLTISFLSLVSNPEQGFTPILLLFIKQMIFGAILGYLFALASKWLINSIKLDFEGLYPVLVIALMFTTFSFTDFVGGNGFLAVYICAVYLGNHDFIHKKTILKIFDGFAWLLQIVLFLTLGLLVFPSEVLPYIGVGLAISLFLIFVARPFSVLVSLLPFKMLMRRRLYISWVGLRGAVPIVFATYPLIAGIDKAPMIFNLVFFISVTSVLIQGTTLSLISGWLKVGLPMHAKPLNEVEKLFSEVPKAIMKEVQVSENCGAVEKKIVELGFPKNAIIAMIKRDGRFITPNGLTVIQPRDQLIILTDSEEVLAEVNICLEKKD